jgi:hypothetical protein
VRVNWTDEIPPWLPPLRPPHRGRPLIVIGLVILSAFMVFNIFMGAIGGTHTIFTLLFGVTGLAFLIGGLLRRNQG